METIKCKHKYIHWIWNDGDGDTYCIQCKKEMSIPINNCVLYNDLSLQNHANYINNERFLGEMINITKDYITQETWQL